MSVGTPLVDAYLDELLADVAMVDLESQRHNEVIPDEAIVADASPSARALAAAPAPAPSIVPASPPVPAPTPPANTTGPARHPPCETGCGGDPRAREARPTPADTSAIGAPTRAVSSSSRWLRVGIGPDHYAFELLRVQEVVRVAPIVAMRGATTAVLGVMNLRGRIVPVFDLGRWLGSAKVIADEHSRIVVVERDDELIGVLVTVVEDVATLGREHIEPPLVGSAPGAIVGIARVGHTPTVLLDANALFD